MKQRGTWITLLAVAAIAGCGKEDGGRGPVLTPPSGGVGSLANAGSTARSGAGGGAAGSRAGSGGVSVPTPPAAPAVKCGNTQCQATGDPIMGFTLQDPCCLDAATGKCGWEPPSGGQCVAPPKVVEACPALSPIQPGCCIEDLDRCGIDGSMYGAGCYNLVGSPFESTMPDLVARTCDGMPVDDEGDAGVEDDGGVLEPTTPAAGSGGAGGSSAAGAGGAGAGGAAAAGAAAGGTGGNAGAASEAGRGGRGGRGSVGLGGRGGSRPGRGS